MAQYNKALIAAGAALLLGVAQANPLPKEAELLYRELLKREPPAMLPESYAQGDADFQPAMDFDTDGCYNTPAIDSSGNVAEGLDHDYTTGSEECRDESDLSNNNVYSRDRCNNGWCAHLYDYYFEKDVAVENVIDVGGHRHDWEHIVVFEQDGVPQVVSASAHGDYDVRSASDVRWEGNHPKVVYHKDGGSTHAFRFANEDDDNIENHSGAWFYGPLVSYNGYPDTSIRDTLLSHDFGSASIAFKDESYTDQLTSAMGDLVPDFDPAVDEGTPSSV